VTSGALRALEGDQTQSSNLRNPDFLRAVHLPAQLLREQSSAGLFQWTDEVALTGFNAIIVPVLQGGKLLLDPTRSVSASNHPGMVAFDGVRPAASPLFTLLDHISAQAEPTSGCCPSGKLAVLAQLSLGSLDVGTLDALPTRHPARLRPELIAGQRSPAQGGMLFDLSSPAFRDLLVLVASDIAATPGVHGVILDDLRLDEWPAPVVSMTIRQISEAVRRVAPHSAIVLRTEGGLQPWLANGNAQQLAQTLQTGRPIDHWIHGAALDEPGESALLQVALRCPVPLTLEVQLPTSGPVTVPAMQAFQVVTDERFAGLAVRSTSLSGLSAPQIRSFRSLLDAEAVEERVASMKRTVRPGQDGTIATNVPRLQPISFHIPQDKGSAVIHAQIQNENLGGLNSLVGISDAENPVPSSGESGTAPTFIPLEIQAPAPLAPLDSSDPEPQPAPAATPLNLSELTNPVDPTAVETAPVVTQPREPDPIRVPLPPLARVPVTVDRLRVAEPATDEDIAAFLQAPFRRQRPSAFIRFVSIDHSDKESPLAPPNPSEVVMDYAAKARAISPRNPEVAAAPLRRITTLGGRTFFGRVLTEGDNWRIEVPTGGIVNIPASRVRSAETVQLPE
jgi:hypothetical protein